MIFVRLILKLFAAPVALAFTVLAAVLAFIHSASEKLFALASGLAFIGALVLLVTGETTGGIAFMVGAFLISPFGLYTFAGWLVDLLGNAGGSLRAFIRS